MEDMLQCVLGPVSASAMRWVHPHEHLVCAMNEWDGVPIDAYPGQMEYARRQMLAGLVELKQYGVTGLVDPLPRASAGGLTRGWHAPVAGSGVSSFLPTASCAEPLARLGP